MQQVIQGKQFLTEPGTFQVPIEILTAFDHVLIEIMSFNNCLAMVYHES